MPTNLICRVLIRVPFHGKFAIPGRPHPWVHWFQDSSGGMNMWYLVMMLHVVVATHDFLTSASEAALVRPRML